MAAILNGRLDLATLVAVPGGLLRADAAAAWIQVRAATGLDLRPTSWADTYRSYAVQERIFRERYTTAYVTGIDPRRWLGQTWWRRPGTASAAVPGTSNHGWGVAIDVTALGGFAGSTYARLAAVAPAHGWSNWAGRQINEAWHWEYTPAADTHPTPAQEDDMPLTTADLDAIQKRVNAALVSDIIRGTEFQAAAKRAVAEAAGAAVWDHRLAKGTETPVAAKAWLVDTRIIVAQLPAMVVAALPPGGTGGATLAQVEAAVKLVLAKLTGTLTLKSV